MRILTIEEMNVVAGGRKNSGPRTKPSKSGKHGSGSHASSASNNSSSSGVVTPPPVVI